MNNSAFQPPKTPTAPAGSIPAITPDIGKAQMTSAMGAMTTGTQAMANQSAVKSAAPTGNIALSQSGTYGIDPMGDVYNTSNGQKLDLQTFKSLDLNADLLKKIPTPEAGASSVTDVNGATGTTGNTATNGAPPAPEQTPYDKELTDLQGQKDSALAQFQSALGQFRNGTFPLSATEQAQVDALAAQTQGLIRQQTQQNTAYKQGVEVLQQRQGIAGTVTALNQINGAINAGLQKVQDIETKAAGALAQMKQGFETNDLALVNESYNAYTASLKDKSDTIQKMQDHVRQVTLDAQNLAHQQLQDKLDSDKFTYAQKQDAIDNAFKQGQIDETKRHNLSVENAARISRSGLSVPTLSTGAPNPIEQAKFLQGLPPDVATLVKQLADYKIDPGSFSVKSGLTRSQMLALVSQYDPTYDQSQYKSRAALRQNFTSGQGAQNIRSINTAVQHLGELQKAANALGGGPIGAVNWVGNVASQLIGQPQVNKFDVAATAVESELANVFKGTGASDQEIKAWRSSISPNMSPSQLRATIQSAVDLMAGRLSALQSQWQSGMGKPADFQILNDNAKSILQQISPNFDASQFDPTYVPVDDFLNMAPSPTSDVSNQDFFNSIP